ncbi:DNA-binding domain-containing protein [Nostoc sp. LEGE 12450]|uniref:DNA-binding domain-containing protein n=1 Tax=Nostoc sp. LEGE 12450 TaxID=1828643 RepID=UPI0018809050|nr:DNA-binding domain-containing protein [Nostoc sp. LEGE 12450]MBE8992397.1 DNA-binding domain-containing protein [Nostoc sp. LEGE 12450]
MVKPQIVVRLPPDLLEKLNKYAQQTGTSKTDVVIGALAQYLGCGEALPLNQKVAELETRMATIEALVKVS